MCRVIHRNFKARKFNKRGVIACGKIPQIFSSHFPL